MTQSRTVAHATIVSERHFEGVSRERLFAAWADPAQRKEWDLPGADDWLLVELACDFRVGGRERARFGPAADPRFWSEGEYLDILPNERIISAGAMHDGPSTISTTLCTVEFFATDTGSSLILTDQSAFFVSGEKAANRESGWGQILERLARFLAARAS